MLPISNRGSLMPESPIRKLAPLAEAAKQKGLTVYHLNIGQPDIATPQAMIDAVKENISPIIEYSHSAGNESYRHKLVSYYAKHAINIQHSDIIVTTGASEAILFSFLGCLDVGDEVIIPEPFYANYHAFAIVAGIKVIPVSSAITDGFSLPALAEIEAKITDRTKAILICNPNNPTGYLYSEQELKQLENLVIKYNLYLFADEAYREFCYGGKHYSALQFEHASQHVILVDSISKRYSACGLRLGAIVTKNKLVINTIMKFAQARLSPPYYAQVAAEAAIDLPDDYFTVTKTEYNKRRDILVKRLNGMKDVFCPNPGGSFYAMAKLPIDNCDTFCTWLLNDFSYNNTTIMLAPGTGFYETKGMGLQEVRFAYVLNTESINAAMDCLEEALKVYPGNVNNI